MNPIARLILIVLYSILGLAAAGRSTVQILERFNEAPVPYTLSAISACLYVLIAVALWRGWHTVALVGTIVELVGVITVGTLGYVESSWWPDETVWTGYGSAYGWVPVLLPIVALWFLVRARRAALVAAPHPATADPA